MKTAISFAKALWHSRVVESGQLGGNRERQLLEYVLKHAEKGNPLSVLHCIDTYSRDYAWLMNIGDLKGSILDSSLHSRSPTLCLELGTYCGYSAVRIASRLHHPRSLLISIESDPRNIEIANQIIEHAGLLEKVKLLLGTLENVIEEVKSILKESNQDCLDFVLLDHYKECYLPDYLLLKREKMLGPGTVIFADNMGFPGAPKFWAYLKSNTDELSTEYHKCSVEYLSWIPDTVTVSTYKRNSD